MKGKIDYGVIHGVKIVLKYIKIDPLIKNYTLVHQCEYSSILFFTTSK